MTGRAPLTAAELQQIGQRKQAGATHAQVAQELGCSPETVRQWWRRQRRGMARRPRGRPRHGPLASYPAAVREVSVRLKRSHPHWGPANVRLELQRELGLAEGQLPSKARLAALFKVGCPEAVQPRRRHQYAERAPSAVRQVHQRWQIDAKERVPVGAAAVASILEIREPLAALMLGARAFATTTAKGWRKLTLREAQATLRIAFSEWGLPHEVQTDHEDLYIGAPNADFPSLFTLWLVGLGISHVTSRNRRPTDQGAVERNHRTLADMAWRDTPSSDVQQLQLRLDAMRQRHNSQLPLQAAACAGRPPLVVHPEAQHSGRFYHPASEWELFSMARVDAYLASRVWVRQICANGSLTLGSHKYSFGRAHAGQRASARFEPATRTFHFQLADGTELAQRPALGLDKGDIIGFIPADFGLDVPIQLPLFCEGGMTL